jgi:hypothetical protein
MFVRLNAFRPLAQTALLLQPSCRLHEPSGHLALPLLLPFHLNHRDCLLEISLLEITLIVPVLIAMALLEIALIGFT